MYEKHFGLRERPFDLTPNPRFLFMSRRHREALTHVRYGLAGRPGITVIVGEAGTGKTTLVRTALTAPDIAAARVVHLSNPTLTRPEFFEYLAAGFGFEPDAGTSKTRFLHQLEAALAGTAGGVLALIVDEAQSLSHELLEEVRLLTNVQGTGDRSLALMLVGQPELAAKLSEPSLRQLKQRVTLRCELMAFELKETAAYISTRVRCAGGSAESLFTRDAIVTIHERSGGIPRTISVICENALINGFAADVRPVGRDIVLEVCRDFDLGESDAPGRSPAPSPMRSPAAAAATSVATIPSTLVVPGTAPALQAAARTNDRGGQDSRPLFSGFNRPRRFSFF
jgi:type II secretory pathway predicted ATPase ExeA